MKAQSVSITSPYKPEFLLHLTNNVNNRTDVWRFEPASNVYSISYSLRGRRAASCLPIRPVCKTQKLPAVCGERIKLKLKEISL